MPPASKPADASLGDATWLADLANELAARQVGGYHAHDLATEPTALAALAILARPRAKVVDAGPAIAYLNRGQAKDGAVGVRIEEPEPAWPTSLAALTWTQAARLATDPLELEKRSAAAVAWILSQRGKTLPRDPEIGHDSELAAWSWAANTHSWIEPTALNVLALKSAGKAAHPRVREAVAMLIDRQLPGGGCNYGNTYVLGQMLRPQLEPSGLLALALADELDPSGRLERTLEYLESNLTRRTPPISLAWALLGLVAHGREPGDRFAWLQNGFEKVMDRDPSTYKLALLAQAALGERSPLIQLPRKARND